MQYKMRYILSFAVMAFFLAKSSATDIDINKPIGWVTCASMTSKADYPLRGGMSVTGTARTATLTATGNDQRLEIALALADNDVIIFDGSKGDFILSASVTLKNAKHKTIVGINGATLCTKMQITPEFKAALDAAGVKSASGNSGTGGYLSNGKYVSEQREMITRQTAIDFFNDPNEKFRQAGVLTLNGCEDIIIRNIRFVGPGTFDVSGNDLITCLGTTHLWVDHCEFTDGLDGNFDITNHSNFVTATRCIFRYTDRSYDHMLSNLIGSSDDYPDEEDNLNVTFAYNIWSSGCNARMPFCRYGTIHVLNNLYTCSGASQCITARYHSEVLAEGNYFDRGVKTPFKPSADALAYNLKDNIFVEKYNPPTLGTVTVPYDYDVISASEIPEMLLAEGACGATLADPLDINLSTDIDGLTLITSSATQSPAYTIDGKPLPTASSHGIRIVRGSKIITK